MLSADDIVALIRPVKERAGDDAWCAALARLGGGEIEAVELPDDLSNEQIWISVKDAAARCRVHIRTMREWGAEGTVRAMKSGKQVLVYVPSLPIRPV